MLSLLWKEGRFQEDDFITSWIPKSFSNSIGSNYGM